jgi:hypothetical protein
MPLVKQLQRELTFLALQLFHLSGCSEKALTRNQMLVA